MGIQAVIFDFGGTLAEGGLEVASFEADLLECLSSLGYRVSRADLRASQRAALGRLGRTRARWRELSFEDVYGEVLRRLKIPVEEEILGHLYEVYRRNFTVALIPGVEDLLRRLSGRYRLAVLSNTMSDIPRRFLMAQGLGGLFEVIVCSRDLGIRKPDARAFRYVLDRIGASPRKAVFVGDSLEEDIKGAKSVGMTAVWVRGEREGKVQDLDYPPDYVIDTVLELPRVLATMEEN
ncbi:HAD family hydrolase [Candidatus Bathyarchaeota archaeon]|nr:MAG: HAD family hydrolase [Candidatus Bathyarchaeota archaeon]